LGERDRGHDAGGLGGAPVSRVALLRLGPRLGRGRAGRGRAGDGVLQPGGPRRAGYRAGRAERRGQDHAVTGSLLAHAYDTMVGPCKLRRDCAAALSAFPSDTYLSMRNLLDLLVVVTPGLIGMFWGAPLVAREFETGTFRLAWTQGITRTRWLAVKIGGRRPAEHGRRRAAQPHGDLVVRPDREGEHGPAHARHLPPGRHRAGRVRRIRVRPWGGRGVLIRRALPAMARRRPAGPWPGKAPRDLASYSLPRFFEPRMIWVTV
jgi:hypothetical protein